MAESELVDQVDENNQVIGQVTRSEAHEKGLWHRVVHVWAYSPSGKVLFQRRSQSKADGPGLLDASAAGHVQAGVSLEETVITEVKDEIGLDIDLEQAELCGVRRIENPIASMPTSHRRFTYMYAISLSEDTEFVFNDGEVSEMVWVNFAKFKNILNDQSFFDEFVAKDREYISYVIDELGKRIEQGGSNEQSANN